VPQLRVGHNETRERERERERERGGEKREPPEGIRTMLPRDASARGARGPRITYLEQEVEKIRRPVAINNASAHSRGSSHPCDPDGAHGDTVLWGGYTGRSQERSLT